MPKIVVSPLAQADIDEIWDYIARDSVPDADRFVDRIERRFGLLADNSKLGSPQDALRPGGPALRPRALPDLLSSDPGRNRSGPRGARGTQARDALRTMTSLYDQDFAQWVERQVEPLRSGRRTRGNDQCRA
jgi:toxin ParE1/3/4